MLVGMTRFERATSWTQTRHANQVAPHPAWHGWKDSNLHLAALEATALPVELHPYRAGGEPRTRYLQFGRLPCNLLHLTGLWS